MTRRPLLSVTPLEERVVPALGGLLHTLNNPLPSFDESFGSRVAVDGNLAVIGEAGDDSGGVGNAGAAHVFDITSGALVATLNNPAPAAGDAFGSSVAISGTRVVVGAESDDPGGVNGAGAAYVFDAITGALVASLNSPPPAVNDDFGFSVAISDTRVVVGAERDDPGGVDGAGAAYVFEVATGALVATLNNPAPAANDDFGFSVAISGTRVVVGARGDDPGGVANAGAAYVFDTNSPPMATDDAYTLPPAAGRPHWPSSSTTPRHRMPGRY